MIKITFYYKVKNRCCRKSRHRTRRTCYFLASPSLNPAILHRIYKSRVRVSGLNNHRTCLELKFSRTTNVEALHKKNSLCATLYLAYWTTVLRSSLLSQRPLIDGVLYDAFDIITECLRFTPTNHLPISLVLGIQTAELCELKTNHPDHILDDF